MHSVQWKHLCFDKETQFVWHENCTKEAMDQNKQELDAAHLTETVI